jgi:hypothetical protein
VPTPLDWDVSTGPIFKESEREGVGARTTCLTNVSEGPLLRGHCLSNRNLQRRRLVVHKRVATSTWTKTTGVLTPTPNTSNWQSFPSENTGFCLSVQPVAKTAKLGERRGYGGCMAEVVPANGAAWRVSDGMLVHRHELVIHERAPVGLLTVSLKPKREKTSKRTFTTLGHQHD